MIRLGSVQTIQSRQNRRGFTLIELLTVILIMSLLMAMVIGIAALANRKNLESKTKADLETIRTALTDYQGDVGEYPPEGTSWTNDLEDYIHDDFDFEDPWGNAYQYRLPNPTSYRLYSLGTDGLEGSAETDADNLEAGRF